MPPWLLLKSLFDCLDHRLSSIWFLKWPIPLLTFAKVDNASLKWRSLKRSGLHKNNRAKTQLGHWSESLSLLSNHCLSDQRSTQAATPVESMHQLKLDFCQVSIDPLRFVRHPMNANELCYFITFEIMDSAVP